MDYRNDVFISYKRGRMNEQWLDEIFLPLFETYLNDVLPNEVKIFVDRSGITPGVDFNDDLFRNLVFSKSFVSIWSNPYFKQSEWCVKEFLTMNYQQQLYKIAPGGKPPALIWPLLLSNLIDPVPPMVQKIHYLDYCDYNRIGEAFIKSERYLDFQEKLRNDVKILAGIINNAPKFHDDLKTPEGQEKIAADINTYLKNNEIDFNLPKQGLTSW
jgi:TIR domain